MFSKVDFWVIFCLSYNFCCVQTQKQT